MQELNAQRHGFGHVTRGNAVVTSAGQLPARFVFHAVGPIYEKGRSGEPEALARCYRTCLRLAEERVCRSISFPSISTGAYGYPIEEAARIAIGEVRAFLGGPARHLKEVLLVQFGAPAYAVYEALLSTAREQ